MLNFHQPEIVTFFSRIHEFYRPVWLIPLFTVHGSIFLINRLMKACSFKQKAHRP